MGFKRLHGAELARPPRADIDESEQRTWWG